MQTRLTSCSRWLSALCLMVGVTASAEQRWGLTWKAPEGCIQASELAERVERVLKRPLFGARPDVFIDGHLELTDGTWRARLTLVASNGTVQGSRELIRAGDSCRVADAPLVLIIVVMIDPTAALDLSAPPTPTPTPAPTPQTPLPPPPDSSLEPPARPSPPPARVLELLDGTLYLRGSQLDHATFYGLVGRPDLQAAASTRKTLKGTSLVIGSVAALVGLGFFVAHSLGSDCVRYAGSPQAPGQCLQDTGSTLIAAGVVTLVAVTALATGLAISSNPTTEAEDWQLIERYNASLVRPTTFF